MRLEPSDKPMYRRMDQKDRTLVLIPIFGIVAAFGLFLLAARYPVVIGGSVVGLAASGMIGSAVRYRQLRRLIMPLSGCYLEIQTHCFVAKQPWLDGRYEQCRIYFQEIEGLVKGAKTAGFYLRIPEQGKSKIYGNGQGQRSLIYVSPFGYPQDQMQAMYQTIKERLPETARVFDYEE